MIEVLSLIKQHGHERVRAAVEEAISLGCSDAAAIRHLAGAADLAHARSAIVELGAALSRFERPLPALRSRRSGRRAQKSTFCQSSALTTFGGFCAMGKCVRRSFGNEIG